VPAHLNFRRAAPADAAVVAAIAERTFRATFADQNTIEDLDALCASAYGETIQRIELEDHSRETWLLESSAGAVGYFMLRTATAPSDISGRAPIEIQRFYLDHAEHGRGAGQQMMVFALERCIAMSGDVAWLGVWERNPRAIAFYRKQGFAVVGSHIFVVGADRQTDLLLQRTL